MTAVAQRFVFDVLSPMIAPVVAHPGEVLVVQADASEPILVVRRGTTDVVRTGAPKVGELLPLLLAEVIRERVPAARVALHDAQRATQEKADRILERIANSYESNFNAFRAAAARYADARTTGAI